MNVKSNIVPLAVGAAVGYFLLPRVVGFVMGKIAEARA